MRLGSESLDFKGLVTSSKLVFWIQVSCSTRWMCLLLLLNPGVAWSHDCPQLMASATLQVEKLQGTEGKGETLLYRCVSK